MKYDLEVHKSVVKALRKSPRDIKKKAYLCLAHLKKMGTADFPFPLKMLRNYKKFNYIEAKISKDYRIVFRFEETTVFIRYAGTHNSLGTG